QEKMDRMVAELSANIEDLNKDGKEREPKTEKTPDDEVETRREEPGEPEPEGADEELTEQEKMDKMFAELSADIEDLNKDGKEHEPETEKTPDDEVETGEPGPEREEEEEKKESEALGANEEVDGYEDATTKEGQEQKEKDSEKATTGKKAAHDKPALEEERDENNTENLAIGPDLYQEESDVNEDAGDEKSEKGTDASDEYKYSDMEEDDHGGNSRRHAVVWSIIAILVLGSASALFVYYKDVNILEHPMVSRWVQKLKLKPVFEDANDLEPQRPKSPATVSQVKTPKTSVSSPRKEAKPGPLTKSEMFEQKMQQILAVRDKLSEKRALAASIREKLNGQVLTLKLEVLAKQRAIKITSYEEAVKSPRINYNIKLIQQLKAYTSKLTERIRYYEEGYDKMCFRYQETEDNFKIIELWSDTKIKRLMAKTDKAINEYQAASKPHMFTNKQIVLDKPLKIWTEITQSKTQNHL
ncbi:MAG: hypothetical protein J7M20_00045, partial [Deltaproteobacteria bacterium]|nr:hypothetical protein [Deltaproteobacteria bacterium]